MSDKILNISIDRHFIIGDKMNLFEYYETYLINTNPSIKEICINEYNYETLFIKYFILISIFLIRKYILRKNKSKKTKIFDIIYLFLITLFILFFILLNTIVVEIGKEDFIIGFIEIIFNILTNLPIFIFILVIFEIILNRKGKQNEYNENKTK